MSPVHHVPLLLTAWVLLVACGGRGSPATASGTAVPASVSFSTVSATARSAIPTVAATASTVPSVATSSIPSVSPTAAATSTAVPGGAALKVTGTGNVGLSLRDAPNGKRLLVVADGATLIALGDPPQDANGMTWIHVKLVSGTDGWVARQFVTGASAPPAATP